MCITASNCSGSVAVGAVRGFADEHRVSIVDKVEEAAEAVEIGFELERGSTNRVSGIHAHLSVDWSNCQHPESAG